MKRLLLLIPLIALLARYDRLTFKANGSFAESKIVPQWSQCPTYDPPATLPNLASTYIYMGKGTQFFVFKSVDSKWVLKLFRLPPFAQRWSFRSKGNRDVLHRAFEGCNCASLLPDETRVSYVHLAPTPEKLSITLIDKLGRAHPIDLSDLPFVIQRLGTPYFSTFETLDPTRAIESTLAFYSNLYDKGFIDNEPIFDINFGWVDDQPFLLDFGQLAKASELPNKRDYLQAMTVSLKTYLEGSTHIDTYQFFLAENCSGEETGAKR